MGLYYVIRKRSKMLPYLIWGLTWVVFEYIHLHWEFSWVWLNLGNVFAFTPTWIQWYEYTGVFGGTVWILIINALVVKYILKRQSKYLRASILGFALPIVWSYYILYNYEDTSKEKASVIVVQPNIDCYTERYPRNSLTGDLNTNYLSYAEQVRRMLNLLDSAANEESDFILFSETAFHRGKNEARMDADGDVKKLLEAKKNYPNLSIVAGSRFMEIHKIR